MKVLGVEEGASRSQCRGNNKTVIEGEAMPLCQIQPKLMRFNVHRFDNADRDGRQDLAKLRKVDCLLAQSDGRELIEHLHADDTAES